MNKPRTDPAASSPAPALELQGVRKVLGGRPVVDGLDLVVQPGELMCILGPSGCGKTTTLRIVAGFTAPDSGRVRINGIDVTHLDAQRRSTAMVFQNYALWPHMSVLRNVTFGLRARRMAKAEANEQARKALELVGLKQHTGRMPASLSGGEQQRVALARALGLGTSLLLMDEPLSNLDAQLRLRVREELIELQQRTGVTMLFVTHDQDEALSIADRVAVMNNGRFDQVDAPSVVYRQPATAFVAGFIGRVNMVPGRVEAGLLHLAGEPAASALPVIVGPAGAECVPDGTECLPDGAAVEVAVRPEDVLLGRVLAPGDGPVIAGKVTRRASRGHFDEVLVETSLGTLRSYIAPDVELAARVSVRIGRAQLYRSGELVGTALGLPAADRATSLHESSPQPGALAAAAGYTLPPLALGSRPEGDHPEHPKEGGAYV